jgi:hypothetical protein
MKRSLLIVFAGFLFFSSCVSYQPTALNTEVVSIKGIYPNARTTEINTTLDKAWQNTIVFLARYNFTLEIIDKGSSFIQTKTINIGPPTREGANGKLKNLSNEFVGDFIMSTYPNSKRDSTNADDVMASYYVTFFKKDSTHTQLIHGFNGIMKNKKMDYKLNVKSTGYFETLLEEYLQNSL